MIELWNRRVGETTCRLDETVSRLEALAEEHPYKVLGNPDTYNQHNEAWQDCIGRAIDIVKDVETK